MSRPTTKADLLAAAETNYEKLNALIAAMSDTELDAPLDFAQDAKKTEAHWQRDKNLRDILIHLHEWHNLLLDWVTANQSGTPQPFLPVPYNWKTYAAMNQAFWEKHQTTSLQDAKALFAASHRAVTALAERFTNEELFARGAFPWVGGTALGSYFISTLPSHYDWAMRKLKAHKKNVKALYLDRREPH